MGNILSFYFGHDANVTYYNATKQTFRVIELERVFNQKHMHLQQRSLNAGSSTVAEGTVSRHTALGIIKEQLIKYCDYNPDEPLECVIAGTCNEAERPMMSNFNTWPEAPRSEGIWGQVLHPDLLSKYFKFNDCIIVCSHHTAHAACGYYQSPFDYAFIHSFDGGGDDGAWRNFTADRLSGVTHLTTTGRNIGRKYNELGMCIADLYPSSFLKVDLPGKIMGYSAYGKGEENKELIQAFEDLFTQHTTLGNMGEALDIWRRIWKHFKHWQPYTERMEDFFTMRLHKVKNWSPTLQGDYTNDLDTLGELVATQDLKSKTEITWMFNHATQNKHHTRDIELPFPESAKFARNLQIGFENMVVKYFQRKDIRDTIAFMRDNVVMTGGCSLNVLLNERLKNEFGQKLNIYVPPNPDDRGLSFGALKYYLSLYHNDQGKVKHLQYAGMPISDVHRRESRPYTTPTLTDIVDLLKAGKIIGLIQGNYELGPRALGNRSIICDPKFPDMKDTLNAKVKFREWFRPFGPMTTAELAPKYFKSKTLDNLEYMSFAVFTKEEYRDELKAVTHIDNTARLQVVHKSVTPWTHELITAFDGVLLNTSFNVQGKPIINTLYDAFSVLDKTGLDYVLLRHAGKMYLYGKE